MRQCSFFHPELQKVMEGAKISRKGIKKLGQTNLCIASAVALHRYRRPKGATAHPIHRVTFTRKSTFGSEFGKPHLCANYA